LTVNNPVPVSPACETFGTAVKFVSNPALASQQAQQRTKLLFLLHVSGNFEDEGFT
jgi:hypothetical protein